MCALCGTGRCVHGCIKYQCVECGTGLCEHNNWKTCCADCNLKDIQNGIVNRNFCRGCAVTLLGSARKRSGILYCAQCEPNAKPKRVEHIVRERLLDLLDFEPSALDDASFGGASCGKDESKRYRPDILFGDRRLVVDVEIDEDGGHPDEEPECHVGRMCGLTNIFQREDMFGPETCVYFIRFNPNEYDQDHVTLEERIQELADRITELSSDPPPISPRPMVEYMFYHSKCSKHILHAQSNPDAIEVVQTDL